MSCVLSCHSKDVISFLPHSCAVLCYVMLPYAIQCYAMLCYAIQCYAMLSNTPGVGSWRPDLYPALLAVLLSQHGCHHIRGGFL